MSLVHPRKETERTQFYPYLVTFQESALGAAYAPVTGLTSLPCAYVAVEAKEAGEFEVEGIAQDKLLLPGYRPAIENEMQAVLTMPGGLVKHFQVIDVVHIGQGTQTIAILSPQR